MVEVTSEPHFIVVKFHGVVGSLQFGSGESPNLVCKSPVAAFKGTVGKRCMENKKIYAHARSINEMHSNERESMSTYPHRPYAEAFNNAVDVVELLRAPTYRVPNVRHLRVQHTFSSVTSAPS